ncbi:MAG: PAS domain S-box protein [Hyphomicrobiales bacterium]|nr:PAS domain S-box protein [Hyphomicrobiales bacterium]
MRETERPGRPPLSLAAVLVWNVLIAVSYYGFGLVGQLVAISPGNVTLFWPPAGIAMAAVCLMGPAALPGVFLGAVAINTVGFYESVSALGLGPTLFSGLAIGVGSMLQALAGGTAISRLYQPAKSGSEVWMVLTVLAAVAAACLISSSIGAGSLFAAGAVGEDRLPIVWFTWWMGDLIGVILFTPLILDAVWHSRTNVVLMSLVMALGIASTHLISDAVRKEARTAWESQAELISSRLTSTALLWLDLAYAPINSLAVLFDNADFVGDQEFFDAVAVLEDNEPDFFPSSLAFAVSPDAEAARADDAAKGRAAGAWEVILSTDEAGPLAQGNDIGAAPDMAAAIAAARKAPGRVVLGAFVTDADGGRKAVTAVAFDHADRPSVLVGLVDIRALLDGLFRVQVPAGTALYLAAKSADAAYEAQARPIYDRPLGDAAVFTTDDQRAVSAGAELRFRWSFSDAFQGGPVSALANGISISGIFATTGIVVFLGFLLGQNRKIRGRVRERTAELAAQRNRIRAIMENVADAIVTIDENGVIESVNRAAETVFGYAPDEMVGRNIAMVTPPEVSEQTHTGYLRKYLETGESWFIGKGTREVEAVHKDGRRFPMDLTVGETEIDGRHLFIGVARDVTARKEAERQIRESEERLRAILDTSPVGVAFSTQGVIHFANPRFEEIFNIGVGEKAPDLYVDKTARDALIQRLKDDGRVDNHELQMYGQGDQVRDMLVTYLPINYQGEDGILGWLMDITERKEAERRVQESEERLRFSLSAMGAFYWIDDLVAGTAEYSDTRFFEYMGYGPAEIGNSLEEYLGYIHPDDLPGVMARFEDYVAGRVATYETEFRFRRKDGSWLWTMNLGYGLEYDADGTIVRLAGITIDNQAHKMAQVELSEAYSVISSSIQYASRIQRAVLPDTQVLGAALADHFVIWEPRDVVGGDMYWATTWGGRLLVILADCTGHGVPGAFMTLISAGALEQAIFRTDDGDLGTLVNHMHRLVQVTLGQHREEGESDDGLELGACLFGPDMATLTFVGARFDLFVLGQGEGQGEDTGEGAGEVEVIKGTRRGLGYRGIPQDQEYEVREIPLRPGQQFFMSSDGLIDQTGGPKRRSFGKRRFVNLLREIAPLPAAAQRQATLDALAAYQGDEIRRDDVSVIGFKI